MAAANRHYSQRLIKGIVGEYELYGRPDGLISSGRREPEKPFFAFQEHYSTWYDPDGERNVAPSAGQVLAAMLVGQSLNPTPQIPLYGCYINGSIWKLVTLVGKEYTISNGFNALTDDIFDIFRLLKSLKEIVKERVA